MRKVFYGTKSFQVSFLGDSEYDSFNCKEKDNIAWWFRITWKNLLRILLKIYKKSMRLWKKKLIRLHDECSHFVEDFYDFRECDGIMTWWNL